MAAVEDVPLQTLLKLKSRLLDQNLSMPARYRALFSLRNLRGDVPREALISAMKDPSALLAHEAAFCLGQMQDDLAVPSLKETLRNQNAHAMVRHEAAEALGAIAACDTEEILMEGLADPAAEVRDTCQLALRRLQASKSDASSSQTQSPYLSVDPADAAAASTSTSTLRGVLLDESADLYERYAALFALRNRGGPEALDAILAALSRAGSALLRHEVAYVLGQMQDPAALPALHESLKNESENAMVRHEAAEALGAIAGTTSVEILRAFCNDKEPIVAQSCDVALDVLQVEASGAFQYADMGADC